MMFLCTHNSASLGLRKGVNINAPICSHVWGYGLAAFVNSQADVTY